MLAWPQRSLATSDEQFQQPIVNPALQTPVFQEATVATVFWRFYAQASCPGQVCEVSRWDHRIIQAQDHVRGYFEIFKCCPGEGVGLVVAGGIIKVCVVLC